MHTSATENSDTGSATIREKWLNHRRFRFWVILLLLLYTLCGFLLLPALAGKWVTGYVRDNLGREATLEKVRFNPFTLILRANVLNLLDTDGTRLAGFDALLADLQVSSLFNRAWTFREIRLDGAYLHFERFALDDSRLSRLVADANASRPSNAEETPSKSGLPRLRIGELMLNEGRMDFLDHVPPDPVSMAVGPVNISVQDLNTLPEEYGRQAVSIQLPGETRLTWQGSIALAPFESEGDLAVENSHLRQAIAYLQALLPLETASATMSLKTHYRVGAREDGSFGLDLENLEAEVNDLSISGLTPVTEFITIPNLRIQGGALTFPEKDVHIDRVFVKGPGLSAWLDQEGKLSLLDLRPSNSASGAQDDSTSQSPGAWKLGIDEFELEDGSLNFTDNTIAPPGAVGLTGLHIRATGASNLPSQAIPIRLSGNLSGGGTFELQGDSVVSPEFTFDGEAKTDSIPLTLAQPYIQQSLNLVMESGTFGTQIEVALRPGALKVNGSAGVTSLHITETIENENLVGWNQLDVDRFELDLHERSLQLSRMDFDRPFGRIKINPDKTTNLSGLSRTENRPENSPPGPDQSPWALVVGGIRVDDASLDFSDLSLPLPFATNISALNGTLSTIDSQSTEPASIQLEGQVDEFGLARVAGTMSILDPVSHTDIEVEFRNLLMSNLSPYTAQFAGQKIDEGKLNLDLNYVISKGKMQGGNQMILSDLVLGEKVDHPEAKSLPLGLAVALLTDSDGVIDIDLPVEGDVNDPEFRFGGVIWKAFSVLITKVVSAPFRMLGSLIGIESEDLGQFQFLAGRSDLTAPELEKVGQLQQALQQRPELRIEIQGPYNPGVDSPALQFFKLREQVIARMGDAAGLPSDATGMLDQDIRSALESLYSEQFPEQSLESVKSRHLRPPPDKPEGKPALDDLAYAADLRDQLLAAQVITRQDLENLAQLRAEAIRTAFLADGNFDASRIRIEAPVEAAVEDSDWISTELGVSAE